MVCINNDYDCIADKWWSDDEGATASLRYLINPVRFGYFKKILDDRYQTEIKNKIVLDVGCGGGLLLEELAKIGLNVTGVDPSKNSLHTAREHALKQRLDIEYVEAYGEKLPFDDNSFDIVFCCDAFEHVNSVHEVISEISRVLKKGGLFFFDTINRTLLSWIAVIYFMQKCRFTSFVKGNAHIWKMFIKPVELNTILSRNGIIIHEMKGIRPEHKKISLIYYLYKASHKKISFLELADRFKMVIADNLKCSYLGYGIKNDETP